MMKNPKIKNIRAREILDSRGNPTIEVEVQGDFGIARASVPSGASIGKNEARELRDGEKRYQGKGVLKAVKNITKIIFPKLRREDLTRQKEIDQLMIKLDGTENKSHLGANAICGVSMAVCRGGALSKKIPLYQYIAELAEDSSPKLPIPCFNIINGGIHAGNDLSIQEFMICPQLKSFKESLRASSEIYHNLKEILKENYGKLSINIGDEGGFAPPLRRTEEALELILQAIKKAGYWGKVKIALDCAASNFFDSKKGVYKLDGVTFTKTGLLNFYSQILNKYPIISIEDPFIENDWKSFQNITKKFAKKISIIGDDLLTTNPKRIKEAQNKKACNGLLVKVNQIGTVSEAIKAAKLAQGFNWRIMVSHRSGETGDDFIADLAVGLGSGWIKAGAPTRGERVAKYNRLLKIEEELSY